MAPTMCKLYMFKLCLILIVVRYCDSRVFSECGLARDLVRINFGQEAHVIDAVCIAKRLSNLTTNKIGLVKDQIAYGLYQIPEKYCKVGEPGGVCNVTCESLLEDEIGVATKCFTEIFYVQHVLSDGNIELWPIWLEHDLCLRENRQKKPHPLLACQGLKLSISGTSQFERYPHNCGALTTDP